MSQAAPCEGAETVSSMIRLRSLGKTIPPAVVMDLPLDVSLRRCSTAFRGHGSLERLFVDEFDRGEI